MLALLEIDDPPDRYSLGRNTLRGSRAAVRGGMRVPECALQDAEGWVESLALRKTSLSLEVRDRNYVELESSGPAVSRRLDRLMAVMGDALLPAMIVGPAAPAS